jgi:hypothetical protein
MVETLSGKRKQERKNDAETSPAPANTTPNPGQTLQNEKKKQKKQNEKKKQKKQNEDDANKEEDGSQKEIPKIPKIRNVRKVRVFHTWLPPNQKPKPHKFPLHLQATWGDNVAPTDPPIHVAPTDPPIHVTVTYQIHHYTLDNPDYCSKQTVFERKLMTIARVDDKKLYTLRVMTPTPDCDGPYTLMKFRLEWENSNGEETTTGWVTEYEFLKTISQN